MTVINCESRAEAFETMRRLREAGIVCELTGTQLRIIGDLQA